MIDVEGKVFSQNGNRPIGPDQIALEARSYEQAQLELDLDAHDFHSILVRCRCSGGCAEHHVADAEYWGGGIVHSDCGIEFWFESREWQCKVQRGERNNDYELGSKQHHGDSAQRSDHRQRGGDSGGWSSEFWRYLRSDGGTEHHIANAEHWGSGIVDSDCWIQLWAESGKRQCKVQRGECNNDCKLGSKQHHGDDAQRGDHRQRGSDGGGRSGQFWRSLHGDGSTEHHIANAEHWGSGIVDSDCRDELRSDAGQWWSDLQRHERNNDYKLGSKQHHGDGAQRGDHRKRGSDGGGRSGELWRSLHGDVSTEHHIANAEHW